MRESLPSDAERLLNDPAFKEAMERMDREILKKLKKADFDGSEAQERYREKLNLLLYCSERFKSHLTQMISTGKVKEAQLDRKTLVNRKGL